MDKLKLLTGILGIMLLTACNKNFNDYYDGNSTVGLNVVQVLAGHEDLTLFARLIEKADLSRTLGESGIYTVLAPRNKDVQKWLDDNGYTLETVPDEKLIPWINYHFITGRNYLYDIEENYKDIANYDLDLYPSYNVTLYSGSRVLRNTRGDKRYPAKKIRLFTPSYFSVKRDDYIKMHGVEPGDFMAEGTPVSSTERDIPASNGVVHILDGELPFLKRCDEIIMEQNNSSIMQNWLKLFRRTEVKGEDSNNQVDTTTVVVYNISETASGSKCNIADESVAFTMLLPTDDAVKGYFGKYMTPEYFGTEYDSIPKPLLVNMLQSLVYAFNDSYAVLGVSSLSNDYTVPSYSSTILALKNDIPSMCQQTIMSSNAVIYEINSFPELPIFSSVEMGLYLHKKRYTELHKLMETTGAKVNTTDVQSYQNTDFTLLLPPDDTWDKKLNEYEENYYDSLAYDILKMGALVIPVKDGNFEHRFYRTASGKSLLYEEGTFTDPWGNKLVLEDKTPVFSAEHGSIYDIDGMPQMMYATDTTCTVMKQMAKEATLSVFMELCRKSGEYNILNNTQPNTYTIFAPTNDAFTKAGISANNISEERARTIVRNHVILNRDIFTDGQTTGNITSYGNLRLDFSGGWDSFRIGTTYNSAGVVSGVANIQGSNGVIHGIDKVLEN